MRQAVQILRGKVNGKLLIDAVEDSKVWSSNTSENFSSQTPVTNMFNGDLTTAAGIKSSTTEFFVDNIGIENVTSVEVLGYCTSGSNGGYNQYYVNELSFVPNVSRSCNETDVWTTLYSGTPITLNKITGKSANPSFSSEIYAVRVNGILMLTKAFATLATAALNTKPTAVKAPSLRSTPMTTLC